MPDAHENNSAVISLGSNICPEKYIPRALAILRKNHRLIAESRFVKTRPLGYADQDDFINGAVKIQTRFSRHDLTRWLKALEKDLGRVRTKNINGPRTIDLDIVAWNDRIVDEDVYTRSFLRNAVYEIAPRLFDS